MPAPQLEWKTIPLTDAKVSGDGPGALTGYASTFGNLDSYGDTIQPGAYTGTLDSFVKSGFISWGHDWACMIGTVSSAKQDSRGLLITADFHSTPDAQQARTIAAERLARGKSMGLSIGYVPTKWSYQEDPTTKQQIRVLEEIQLLETSLVAIPADSYAGVTGMKSHPLTERPSTSWLVPGFKADEPASDPDESSDPETLERFADQGERVLLDLTAFAGRATDLAALRQKSGRVLSEANPRRLATLREQINELSGQLDDLLTATEPAPTDDDPKAQQAREIEQLFARFQALDTLHRDLNRHSAELEGARP